MTETPRQRAEQSVSTHFTRVMNATTSRWGMFTDPSIVGFATAPIAIALLAAVRLDAASSVVTGLAVVAAIPILVGVAMALALASARASVVEWLASLPFPIENMNAVLNGIGEVLEITFREQPPPAKELNLALDAVSPECFITKAREEGSSDPPVVEVRIGVVDSPRNPSVTNHQRFDRVRTMVAQVLVPLAERYPIVDVRVK